MRSAVGDDVVYRGKVKMVFPGLKESIHSRADNVVGESFLPCAGDAVVEGVMFRGLPVGDAMFGHEPIEVCIGFRHVYQPRGGVTLLGVGDEEAADVRVVTLAMDKLLLVRVEEFWEKKIFTFEAIINQESFLWRT